MSPLLWRPISSLVSHRLDRVFLVAATLLAGWIFRFTQDDAFISMRYARNLADGHGLVFNAGERVEGYTNFLWTVFLAIPHRVGGDPILWSNIASIAAGVVTVLLVASIGTRLTGSREWGVLAACLLLAMHSFAAYLTGGLETQWQTAFLLGFVWLTLPWQVGEAISRNRLVAAGTVAAAACLTRMDSAVFISVALGIIVIGRWSVSRQVDWRNLLSIAAPATVILGAWFIWKSSYYGSITPQTLAAKDSPILWAIVRMGIYSLAYLLLTWMLAVLIVIRHGFGAIRDSPGGVWLLGTCAGWIAYLTFVGADFMEFRFFIPILGLAAVLITVSMQGIPGRRQVLAVFLIVMGSAFKWWFFYPAVLGVESVRLLNEHVEAPNAYREIGQELRVAFEHLPEQDRPTIAVTPAGAIPYYSQLRSLDMLGLTDPGANDNRWELTKLKAGHEHIAELSYVMSHADLILGGVIDGVCGTVSRDTIDHKLRDLYLKSGTIETNMLPRGSLLYEMPLRAPRCLLVVAPNAERGLYRDVPRDWKVIQLDH